MKPLELLEVFDEHNQSLGYAKLRLAVHEEGDLHRTAQIYVLNDRRELLCNFRNPSKDVFPSLWDVSIGGHLAPGETYRSCAMREIAEELGVTLTQNDLLFITTITIDGKDEVSNLIDREHAGIFVWCTNLGLTDFVYQVEEISQLQFFSLEYVKENLRSYKPQIPFIPLQKHLLETIHKIEQHLSFG